jgi:hypothetical protein
MAFANKEDLKAYQRRWYRQRSQEQIEGKRCTNRKSFRRAIGTPRHAEWLRRSRERDKAKRAWITSFKDKPCHDCKQTYPVVVMEFDHARGEKVTTVSSMTSYPIAAVLAEIAKCDVVCANCHKLRSHARGQFCQPRKPRTSRGSNERE